ncbi:MAG: hypothetical protein JXR37_15720 [Kiritimatiellae bacterium]|nr:hypothetical protein [Kiritimatiellia bacterium]
MKTLRFLAVLTSVSLVLGSSFADTPKAGKHEGEKKQLEVEIVFSLESGETLATDDGTYFVVGGNVYYEDKVYPESCQGVYPLYFFGDPVGVTVRLTNNGPRSRFKLCITTESYVLETDGSTGAELMEPDDTLVEIGRGETVEIDATFSVELTPDSESGLNTFVVAVWHPNNGGGPGNARPALICVKEGVFCPPLLD